MNQRIPFQSLALSWLAAKEGRIKPASYAAYASALNFGILPILGEKTEVGEKEVREMMERLQEQGVVETSLRNYVTIVKSVLKFGAEKGDCEFPAWTISTRKRKDQQDSKLVLLTAPQEKKLVKYLMTHPSPRNLGYYLLLATGLKAGELCALKWGAIDLEKGALVVLEGKRMIPLPPDVCKFLRPYAKEKEVYVVTGTSVSLQRPKTLRDGLKSIAKQLEIPAITPQDLRHTFAVRCIQSGCDLVTLMTLMGISEAGPMYAVYGPYVKICPKEAMAARAAALI